VSVHPQQDFNSRLFKSAEAAARSRRIFHHTESHNRNSANTTNGMKKIFSADRNTSTVPGSP